MIKKVASIADVFFFPMAAIAVTAFTILMLSVVPQASVDLANTANSQTSQLEIQSMMSTLFHGYSYKAADETSLTDHQVISYLICGQDFSSGWFDLPGQEQIETGTVELAQHYKVQLETPNTGGMCDSNSTWNPPSKNPAGVNSGDEINQYYQKLIPVVGGNTARATVVYGFE